MDVLLGLQWGDEGKGKIVDYLAKKYDMVARFQGGPNAGHTLEFDGRKHVLHQIPSGIFSPQIANVIGNGVVLDLAILKKEIDELAGYGLDLRQNLMVSKKAHLILPTHRLLDAAQEAAKGKAKIGSTLKGIGPTYQDKTGRAGLRMGDILLDDFQQRYDARVEAHKRQLDYLGHQYDLEPLEKPFFQAVEFFKGFNLVDSEYFLNAGLDEGKRLLAEGAQGALLDVDFGSYPFVTSSNTTVTGACAGLGVPPRRVNNVFGIFKAYCTRVGSGPFPTELHGQAGERLRQAGREFGATTGRPRRCGWLDLPALKYAVMLNGVTQLYMMKADVLSAFGQINVCTHYKLADGSTTDRLPYDLCVEGVVEPQYQTLPGWTEDLTGIRNANQLPDSLKAYVEFIERQVGVPITLVSVGPDRTQTILTETVGV